MIVCVCARVSDSQIKNILPEAKTLEDVQFLTSACLQCQKCKHEIQNILSADQS